MHVLRTSALVLLGIAALDGAFDAVEYLVSRLTGNPAADLWPTLLGIGLVLLIADLLIEHRATVLQCLRETGAWIQSKLGGSSGK